MRQVGRPQKGGSLPHQRSAHRGRTTRDARRAVSLSPHLEKIEPAPTTLEAEDKSQFSRKAHRHNRQSHSRPASFWDGSLARRSGEVPGCPSTFGWCRLSQRRCLFRSNRRASFVISPALHRLKCRLPRTIIYRMRQVETSPFFDFFQVARVARVLLFIIALSICWSLALMLVFAPGLSSNDSAQRAWMMTSVVEAGTTSTYTTPRLVFEHVFPPMMTLTGASLRSIGGGWSLHTFLQACWLFSSFGVLAVLVMGCLRGCLVWLSFCLIPIVWNHTMAMLPDAVVAAALLTITSALLWPTQPARRQLLLRCGIIFASGAFAFGYRFNTVTVLPLLVVAVFVMSPRFGKLGAASLVAALVLSAGIGPLLQRLVPYRESDVVAPMLAWEHVGTLRFTGDPDLRARHSLDAILGKDGETARALMGVDGAHMLRSRCFASRRIAPSARCRFTHPSLIHRSRSR